MQIERAIIGVWALGPGSRLAVWVNGCHRGCPGCVSPRLQKNVPQNERNIEEYFDRFDLSMIDGVTISGGEPFDQPKELCHFVKYIRKRGIADILVYTGYTVEQLREMNDDSINYVLANISVLIDGPYIREQDRGVGNMKGSDNQRVIVFDSSLREIYDSYYKPKREMQEFFLGSINLSVGIPDEDYINSFLKDC